MIAAIRTFVTIIVMIIFTTSFGLIAIVAALFREKDRPGSTYDWVPREWSKWIMRAAGVTVRIHNPERALPGAPRIFVANHLSWFDITALASFLPWPKFVAKAELFKVPVFGQAIRAAGMIEIQRENRKAAFDSYKIAGAKIQQGISIVVFPEGTRGTDYSIRQLKKGPFILAVAAGVPIVPIILHGTMEITPKHKVTVRPGVIDVHLLEPVPTAGLGYDDRDQLMATVRERMVEAMRDIYGVDSPPTRLRRVSAPGATDQESPETEAD